MQAECSTLTYHSVLSQNLDNTVITCNSLSLIFLNIYFVIAIFREEEEGRTTSRQEVTLTPEMVTAQFSLIDTSTPTDEKTSQYVYVTKSVESIKHSVYY